MSGGGQHQPRGGGGHGQLDKRKAIDNPYVDDHTVPKKIAGIQFGMLPGVDMRTLSEVEIVNRSMYKMNTRIPESYGPLDPKLGVSVKKLDCSTCGQKVDDCPGHFGFVSLQLPVFHIGYIKQIHLVLKLVCKSCCRVALPDSAREKFLKDAKRARKDPQKIKHFVKEISKAVAQNLNCPHCGELNGDIRRIPPMKFVHNKWKKRAAEGSRAEFEQLFTEAAKSSPDLKQYISKVCFVAWSYKRQSICFSGIFSKSNRRSNLVFFRLKTT
jgi:DNA-directed RNA polymerase III subunit RPC1